MSIFTLIPYSLRVREIGSDNPIQLGKDYNTAHIDLLDFLEDFLQTRIPNWMSLSIPAGEEDQSKQVIGSEQWNRNGRIINGIFRAGGYGYASPLLNVETGGISYERTRQDAELIPFYFLTKVIPTSDIGVILLQTFNSLGIKDLLFSQLQEYFRARYSNFIIEMSPLIPPDLAARYLLERIVEIRLVKFGYPHDLIDMQMNALPEQEQSEGNFEMVLKVPPRKSFPYLFVNNLRDRVNSFVNYSTGNVENIVEVTGFRYDTAKIKVKFGKGYRTVDLSRTERLKYSEELDEDVEIDPNTGHPVFDSVDKLAKEFLDECVTAVWGGDRDV